MMKRLLQHTKGESTILGYVLLIALVVGMAGGVFAYLKFYLPKTPVACPEDLSIIIASTNCTGGNLTISVANQGLFNIDGAFIKIGAVSRAARTTLNCVNPSSQLPQECNAYFNSGPLLYTPEALEPGQERGYQFVLPAAYSTPGTYDVEVQPVLLKANFTRIICEKSTVTRKVVCG